MKKSVVFCIAVWIAMLLSGTALGENLFEPCREYDDHMPVSFRYWLYAPEEVTADTPLVVFLHGYGERDGNALYLGLPALINDGTISDAQAVVVAPQLPKTCVQWIQIQNGILRMIQAVQERFHLRQDNVTLCGFSLGGMGALDIAARHPGVFARVMDVGGRVSEGISVEAFADTDVRIYMGSLDEKLNRESAARFAAAMEKAGYDAHLTVWETDHQRILNMVFQDEEALGWLFSSTGHSAVAVGIL